MSGATDLTVPLVLLAVTIPLAAYSRSLRRNGQTHEAARLSRLGVAVALLGVLLALFAAYAKGRLDARRDHGRGAPRGTPAPAATTPTPSTEQGTPR
jgi:hypothetical protein